LGSILTEVLFCSMNWSRLQPAATNSSKKRRNTVPLRSNASCFPLPLIVRRQSPRL
jgi:hypothetical protein